MRTQGQLCQWKALRAPGYWEFWGAAPSILPGRGEWRGGACTCSRDKGTLEPEGGQAAPQRSAEIWQYLWVLVQAHPKPCPLDC